MYRVTVRNPKNGNSHTVAESDDYTALEKLFIAACNRGMLAIFYVPETCTTIAQSHSHAKFEREFC
jgi:hypothetical protein